METQTRSQNKRNHDPVADMDFLAWRVGRIKTEHEMRRIRKVLSSRPRQRREVTH